MNPVLQAGSTPNQHHAKASHDTLAGLAHIVIASHPDVTPASIRAISANSGLSEQEVEQALLAAQQITANHQMGASSLERDPDDPFSYLLRAEGSAAIHVEDPNRPGYGYGITIHADHDGPSIETWPYNPKPTPLNHPHTPLDRIDWSYEILDDLLEETNA